MIITRGVIPLAGKGKTWLPISKVVPKEFLPIGKKPVLAYTINELASVGITEICLVISISKVPFLSYFGSFDHNACNYKTDCGRMVKLEYIIQHEPTGLADAIHYSKRVIGRNAFVVALPDEITTSNEPLKKMIASFEQTNHQQVGIQKTSKDLIAIYGNVKIDSEVNGSFKVLGAVEKPEPKDILSDYRIVGRYVFDFSIFEAISSLPRGKNGEKQITDALNKFAISNKLTAHNYETPLYDTGNFKGFLEANIAIGGKDETINK